MATDHVILENNVWDQVNVEVTKGNNADPAANPSLGTKKLLKNENWAIDTEGENINYRRDRDPNFPDGTWEIWKVTNCFGMGDTFNVSL